MANGNRDPLMPAQSRELAQATADLAQVLEQLRQSYAQLARAQDDYQKQLQDLTRGTRDLTAEEKKRQEEQNKQQSKERDRQKEIQTGIMKTAVVTQGATGIMRTALQGPSASAGQFADQIAGVASAFGPWGMAVGGAAKAVGSVLDLVDARTRRTNEAVVQTFGEVLDGTRSVGQAVGAVRVNMMAEGFRRAAEAVQEMVNPTVWGRLSLGSRMATPGGLISTMLGGGPARETEAAVREAVA